MKKCIWCGNKLYVTNGICPDCMKKEEEYLFAIANKVIDFLDVRDGIEEVHIADLVMNELINIKDKRIEKLKEVKNETI